MAEDPEWTLAPPRVRDLAGLRQRLEVRLFSPQADGLRNATPSSVVVGRYELVDPIGRGSAAVVWHARDLREARDVAVKLLRSADAHSGTASERLLREARLAAQLHHPHVVSVHDCGTDPVHGPYVVMERIRAESLGVLIARLGRIAWPTVRKLVVQIADALAYAHGRGIVHRDVTPGNVLVSEAHHCWVVDFGLARRIVLDPASAELTASGVVLGTPRYISPEQARALPTDGRSDMYALGCIAYEMLAGVAVAPGASIGEVLVQHLRIEPPTFAEVDPEIEVPLRAEAVVRQALRKSPNDRFASMAAFRDAILAVEA